MLTVSEVKNARPKASDYKLFDSNGLFLFVAKSGTKSWRYKYRHGKRERVQTFGQFPEVGLAEARQRRERSRALLREGKDPITEAKRERQAQIAAAGATFAVIAEQWVADQALNRTGFAGGHSA